MNTWCAIGVVGLSMTASAMAAEGIPSLDLSRYDLSGPFPLPPVAASEASAVTWDWDSDTLFVIGDEGEALVQLTKRGALLAEMELENFDDTEGLTYLGNGAFVIVEERIQDLYRLTWRAGESADRDDLDDISIGGTVGNVGLEGVTYDAVNGSFITVKEKTPQRVQLVADPNFAQGTADVGDLFLPNLGLADLSDVQSMSTVASLAGRPDGDHLLILSQESQRLLEVTTSGGVLGVFDLSGVSSQIEGVTIDRDGVIYLVDETPNLWVLTPGCLRDVTDDDVVDSDDVMAVIDAWGTTVVDIDGSGSADFGDLLAVLAGWGDC